MKDSDLIEASKRMLQFIKNAQFVSLEKYNQEIEDAEERISNGQFLTQEQVEQRLKG